MSVNVFFLIINYFCVTGFTKITDPKTLDKFSNSLITKQN